MRTKTMAYANNAAPVVHLLARAARSSSAGRTPRRAPSGRRALEPVRDGLPLDALRQGLNDNEPGALRVATV